MDIAHHEMQFMGLFRIYRESLKLTFKLRTIFSQITLTLILPLTLVIFAHEYLSGVLQFKIWHNQFHLAVNQPDTPQQHHLRHLVTVERAASFLIEILYLPFVLAFSLLSTSALVYSIASFYASGEISYRRVMSVVPKVWKRLVVTLFCAYATFLACVAAFGLTIGAWSEAYNEVDDGDDLKLGVALLVVVLVVYGAAFVYLAMVWQMASVVSVMEDVKGFKAVVKGARLVRGKVAVCVLSSVMLIAALVGVYSVYMMHVDYTMLSDESWWGVWKGVVVYGGACVVAMMGTILLGTVVETVVYMVCKSYHHENINKSALADHLEGIYSGEYVPLQGGVKIEMGEFVA